MADLVKVTDYLGELDDADVIRLGLSLGLSRARLNKMKLLPEDMIAAWLRGDDEVKAYSGTPSWDSLVTKLEERGHTTIASTIKEGKFGWMS